MNFLLRHALFPAVLLAASLAFPADSAADPSMSVSHELDVDLGFVGDAPTFQNDRRVGSVNALDTDVKYIMARHVTNDLLVRVGAEWARIGFSTPAATAVPDTLQQVSAVIGLDYQVADQWLMRAEVQPGIYSDFREFDTNSFNAPLVVGVVYLQDDDLQWVFGLRFDARSGFPLFPAAGVRWKFADVWTLDAQLPQPRLLYELNDDLQAFVGAGVKAATYVVSDHFGTSHGLPQLNNATVDYTEVRVGAGFSWKVLPELTLEAGAGSMVSRTWDFVDRHVELDSRPAPYFQLAARARF